MSLCNNIIVAKQRKVDMYKKLDRFEQATADYWRGFNVSFMAHVKPEDYMDVLVDITIPMSFEECVDNARVYPIERMTEYDKVKMQGCCGFFDRTSTGRSGQVYLIGFNYGH